MTEPNQKPRRRKSPNGEAVYRAYNLKFEDNSTDERARRMAQELAKERRLKDALTGFLVAMYEIRELSGSTPNLEEMFAKFTAGYMYGMRDLVSSSEPGLSIDAPMPSLFSGTVEHEDAATVRSRLALGMGNLMADDDDGDFWDD